MRIFLVAVFCGGLLVGAYSAHARPDEGLLPVEGASVVLDGAWRFHSGDDPEWADPSLDDSGWAQVEVPGSWVRQGHGTSSFGWYRRTVDVPPQSLDSDPGLGLRFRQVFTSWRLYADGALVGGAGEMPPDARMAYDRREVLPIPAATLRDGQVVLALRVYRDPAAGSWAGLASAPEMGRLPDLVRRDLFAEIPALILVVVFLVAALFHLLFFRTRSGRAGEGQGWLEDDHLAFAAFASCQAAFVFLDSQWRFTLGDDFVLLKQLEYLARFLLPVFAIQFLWCFLRLPMGRLLRAYQASHLLLAVAGLLTPGLAFELSIVRAWELWTLPLLVAVPYFVIRRALAGRREAQILLFGVLFAVFTFGHDIAVGRGLFLGPSLSPWGFLVLVLSMAVAVFDQFARSFDELHELRNRLEARVAARTRELAEARDAAEAANRAKSRYLADLSHEIRTPMTAILGMTELLLSRDVDPSLLDPRKWAETVHKAAVSLLDIIDDVLDVSKIEAGKIELHREEFDPAALLRDVVKLMSPRAEAKGLTLELGSLDALPPRVRTDPSRLRQVLVNLVGNAVKFTAEGGVALHAFPSGEGDTLMLRFAVSDSGIGLDQHELPNLFEAFYRGEGAGSFDGAGLGLSISHRLVECLGGRIGAESERGSGSTFWFEVPVERVEAEVEAVSQDPHAAADGGTILVVDDHPVNRLVISGQVESLGHRVRVASGGEQALAILDEVGEGYFDLLLLDCRMPDLDGYEVARRVRADESASDGGERLPIVAVTAHALEGERERCLEAGMDDFLSKPFRMEQLEEILGRWLPAGVRVES